MHNRYLELDIPKMELLTLYAVQRLCFLSSLPSKSKTVLMVDVGKKGRGTERKKEKERKKRRKPISSVQFSSAAQSGPTLCDPMNRSTPGLPVHHQLPEITQNSFFLPLFIAINQHILLVLTPKHI